MYLRNELYKKYDGYILLNIFSEIKTKFKISKRKINIQYIKRQTQFIKQYNICNDIFLFYGKNVINKIHKYKLNKAQKECFQNYCKEINCHTVYLSKYNKNLSAH